MIKSFSESQLQNQHHQILNWNRLTTRAQLELGLTCTETSFPIVFSVAWRSLRNRLWNTETCQRWANCPYPRLKYSSNHSAKHRPQPDRLAQKYENSGVWTIIDREWVLNAVLSEGAEMFVFFYVHVPVDCSRLKNKVCEWPTFLMRT